MERNLLSRHLSLCFFHQNSFPTSNAIHIFRVHPFYSAFTGTFTTELKYYSVEPYCSLIILHCYVQCVAMCCVHCYVSPYLLHLHLLPFQHQVKMSFNIPVASPNKLNVYCICFKRLFHSTLFSVIVTHQLAMLIL